MEFKEILEDILIERALNQTEFAKKIGVKQSQVSEWLKGKNKPAYHHLRQICLQLGISGDKVLGLDENGIQ